MCSSLVWDSHVTRVPTTEWLDQSVPVWRDSWILRPSGVAGCSDSHSQTKYDREQNNSGVAQRRRHSPEAVRFRFAAARHHRALQ